ncbi:protein transport protein [Lasallia pustulata]|uniref:Protein transport protein SEC31 n=1 Tax=Lasallia pustulata TaxID=136370 RepID=A0A1W5CZ47_9LECA|nr:protein transport protein [Lasallia pustulata]
MVRLREIPRTATFAWSPGTNLPFLATGTRAGAVDADFSNDTQLELWDLDLNNTEKGIELQPAASIDTDSRFHDIAWVRANDDFPRGVVAGALENGSLDLWNVEKLLGGEGDALMSRTSKHSGAIKTLQFNPFRSELLATAGAKGELFISDLNNVANPFRLGNSAARADDFECLDWNKKVPHILVTGSSGGFVTVWDVKAKKESLTLNNMGRKAISAVAWDPEKPTRLITAVPHDTDPLILVWDLRNSNAPERILRGHEGGVLSLSWCPQDSDLLLSCGKDNRTICWNPQTGEPYGEFPVVTNWTFQTRWNPHNPNLLATASFDGKIAIQTIQNTKPEVNQSTRAQSQSLDGEDFFNKAQSQPQEGSFTLPKAPKWLERPCGASFGFGGKVLSFNVTGSATGTARHSSVRISNFAVDTGIGSSTEEFEKAVKEGDLNGICKARIADATLESEKADWKVIETLISQNPRKELVGYLGFSSATDETADGISKLSINGENEEQRTAPQANGSATTRNNRLSSFFDSGAEGDSFLSDLAATKGAKTNNPFHIYTGSELDSDRRITLALMLGQFDNALDICLKEDRISDAFMIAIYGGQRCIDKAQKAYFTKKAQGPNYLRLLASVVGKNLWDFVYNADVENWKEVMATICTYANADEFPDLCEALGDRLEEYAKDANGDGDRRKDAAFCYLAGSKLEKVLTIWIAELAEDEDIGLRDSNSDSTFSVHARSLQRFIEKVTVFREVTHFADSDGLTASGWKLSALYDKYTEYADILASHGQLPIAQKYLDLLPERYPAAEVARNRVRQATRKAAPQVAARQSATTRRPAQQSAQNVMGLQTTQPPVNPSPAGSGNSYAPSASSQTQNPYTPSINSSYGAPNFQQLQQPLQPGNMAFSTPYGAPQQSHALGPPRNTTASPFIPPPSKAQNMPNWNDMPESFFKAPTSRRGTPGFGAPAINAPFSNQANVAPMPPVGPPFGVQPRSTPPLVPPPRSSGPPPRVTSPQSSGPQLFLQPERPPSVANTYAPQLTNAQLGGALAQATMPRDPSPYNAPPSAPPPSNRYAPAPASQSVAPTGQQQPSLLRSNTSQGAPPPNPYAPQQRTASSSYAPNPIPQQQGRPSSGPPQGPPQGPPLVPSQGPPQPFTQGSRPGTAQSQRSNVATPVTPKHPPGDRTHIPANAQSIYEILNSDMQRVKSRAPANYKPQVLDTEKRLNILFDHLNNEDLQQDTIVSMTELAEALKTRNYELALGLQMDISKNHMDEQSKWMVGLKRLISMSRVTP